MNYDPPVDVMRRHNVRISGPVDGQPMVFAHGFGCDHHMWRQVASAFEDRYRVVLFDHAGAGDADPSAYDLDRHSSLAGYAEDVVSLCHDLGLLHVVFVGHSVSSMIGALAAIAEPGLFDKLIMVGPSARYLNDAGYVGGFEASDIEALLEALEANYLGWSAGMAPAIVGNADRPELGATLTASFCRTDPAIAARFARVTFTSDNRADLALVTTETLVMQCRNDIIAPEVVGEYVRDHLPNVSYSLLEATGHCPNLSAPEETAAVIAAFLDR